MFGVRCRPASFDAAQAYSKSGMNPVYHPRVYWARELEGLAARVWAHSCLTRSTETSTAGIVPLSSSQCVVCLRHHQGTAQQVLGQGEADYRYRADSDASARSECRPLPGSDPPSTPRVASHCTATRAPPVRRQLHAGRQPGMTVAPAILLINEDNSLCDHGVRYLKAGVVAARNDQGRWSRRWRPGPRREVRLARLAQDQTFG